MDLKTTIAPKSDQLNADDFIGNEQKTIKITDIKGHTDPQQPVAINFEGDNGKPYKPCKSMRRVLVSAWGGDGKQYIGKSLTLYKDASVLFGGVAVGGIRISHMSNLLQPMTIALTASKASRKAFTVQPLVIESPKKIELTPQYKGWDKAKKALQDKEVTIEKLKEMYEISAENEIDILS